METQFKETLNKTEEQKIKKKKEKKGGGRNGVFYYICTYCTDKLVYVEQ